MIEYSIYPPPSNDVEWWKKIKEFPFYEVSHLGGVRSWKNGRYGKRKTPKILKLTPSKKLGHLSVTVSNKQQKYSTWVHILVLEAFGSKKPSPEYECAHIDGNPANNHIDNLRWATALDNATDMIKHGTRRTNQENPFFKKRISMGLKQTEFAELLGVKQVEISRFELGIYGPKKKIMERFLSI